MKLLFISLLAFLTFAVPAVASAQIDINNDVCKNAPAGSKPSFCKDQVGDTKNPENNPIYGPNGIVTKVVNILSMVVGVAAVIFIMVAGFRFIVSGSDPQQVTQQREHIIYALVALVIVAVAQLMVRYVLLQVS